MEPLLDSRDRTISIGPVTWRETAASVDARSGSGSEVPTPPPDPERGAGTDPPIDSGRLYAQAFTVTNGALGPVLWCPRCDRQFGYLADRVNVATLITDARHHIDVAHPEMADE